MGEFEERRKIYFDNLRKNPEVLNKLMEKKENQNKRAMKIILLPRTERELDLAEAMYLMISDLVRLVNDIVMDRVNKVELEESTAIGILIKLINALKENDTISVDKIKSELNDITDSKETAKIIYDLLVSFVGNGIESFNYIARECNVDLNDELSIMQFQLYLNQANEILNGKSPNNLDITDIDVENSSQVEQIVEVAKEFHKLCEAGKVEDGNPYSKKQRH